MKFKAELVDANLLARQYTHLATHSKTASFLDSASQPPSPQPVPTLVSVVCCAEVLFALQHVSSSACLHLSPVELRLIVNPTFGDSEGLYAFFHSPLDALFEAAKVESKASNDILLHFSIPSLLRVVKSADAFDCRTVKLTKKDGRAHLTFEMLTQHVDSTQQLSMAPGSQSSLVQDVPVIVLPVKEMLPLTAEPNLAIPAIKVQMPLLQRFHATVDRLRALSPNLSLHVSNTGQLRLAAKDELTAIQSEWKGLAVAGQPPVGDCEVSVSGRKLSDVLWIERVQAVERCVCCVAERECVIVYCLAEDTQVLTDRGFLSRAEVFAACPELAPSSPTAAPASDYDALPFGGAVLSREASPLYWKPSSIEEAADKAAGIRHEKLGSSAKSAVLLRDSTERYGRQCGVCGERVWSASQAGAKIRLYRHVRLRHPVEQAATAAARTEEVSVTSASSSSSPSRRASLSTASSGPSSLSWSSLSSSSSDTAHSARPPLARPPSLPVRSRSSVDEKEQKALRHATLEEGDGAVRRGSLQFKNPSAMSDVSVERSSATFSSVVSVLSASRQRVIESPASVTRSLQAASVGRSSSSSVAHIPDAPLSCWQCGDDEWLDCDAEGCFWYCWRCMCECSDDAEDEAEDEDEDAPVTIHADPMQLDDESESEEKAPVAQRPLLFASLDPSTGHLVYLPATALTYKLVTQLVEFTHHAEAPHWAEDADEYGLTPEQVKRMKARSDRACAGEYLDEEDKFRAEHRSNGVSLLVDRQHDMFVRVGLAEGKTAAIDYKHDNWSADYVKVKAGALLSDDIRKRVRMMGSAEAGLAPSADELPFARLLGLRTEAEVTAFLLLYGYWCGDGYLDHASRTVSFAPKTEKDKDWVLERLAELHLTVECDGLAEYDTSNGQLIVHVRDERWSDYFYGEYGPKYGVASLTSSRPHTHTGLTVPLPKSVQWSAQAITLKPCPPTLDETSLLSHRFVCSSSFCPVNGNSHLPSVLFRFWVWVWRLRKERARLVLAGLRFADGCEATDVNCIYTSGVDFRDEIVRLALHAGYSAHFDVHCKAGDHRGYDKTGEPFVATADCWTVHYSDHHRAAQPVLRNQRDIDAVSLPSGRPVPVWCVTVPPHHLIIARRVRTNGKGVVTQASRPIVVGNCKLRERRGTVTYFLPVLTGD